MAKVCKCVTLKTEELENFEGELGGIVVNEFEALISPCEHIKGTNLYYSKGIIGALNQEQIEKYCKRGIIEIERPEVVKRHEKWKEAVKICRMRTAHLKSGEKIKAFVECMEKEAKD